jgi:AraC-like DNA-binding protein
MPGEFKNTVRDTVMEHLLTHHAGPEGAGWTTRDLPIAKVNTRRSQLGQVRPTSKGSVVESDVYRFCQMWQDGMRPPAPVCAELPDGSGESLNGLHRLTMFQRVGVDEATFYVVLNPDEEVRTTLAMVLNNDTVPVTMTEQDRLTLIREHKRLFPHKSVEEIAARFHKSAKEVRDILQQELIEGRLADLGFDATALNPSHVKRLSAIQDNSVLKQAAELARDAKLTMDEVNLLVPAINGKHSEQDRLAVVGEWEQRPDIQDRVAGNTGGGPVRTRRPADRLFVKLADVAKFMRRYPTPNDMGLTDPADITRFEAEMSEVVRLAYLLAPGRSFVQKS